MHAITSPRWWKYDHDVAGLAPNERAWLQADIRELDAGAAYLGSAGGRTGLAHPRRDPPSAPDGVTRLARGAITSIDDETRYRDLMQPNQTSLGPQTAHRRIQIQFSDGALDVSRRGRSHR